MQLEGDKSETFEKLHSFFSYDLKTQRRITQLSQKLKHKTKTSFIHIMKVIIILNRTVDACYNYNVIDMNRFIKFMNCD